MREKRPVIAMVTDAIAPYHRGGKEQRYQELAPRLARYADVHVYTMQWWEGRPTMTRAGVTYHAISRFLPLYRADRRSISQAVVFALACFRLLFERFDVLEADHMPYLQLFPLKLVAQLRRKRLVVTWHEVWDLGQWTEYLGPGGLLAWGLERAAMRLPDCIIAASAQTAERLNDRNHGGVPVVTAPSGVDLDLILRTPPASDAVDIVSVGRLLGHKRFDLLLDCVALLASAGKARTCRIVGDGPERNALVSQASRLGIGHLVEFRHDVDSHEELLSLLKASRLFVFPSEREGFGIAALEAIACGLPVITTNAPNNLARYLVGRSARGVLCEPTATALAVAVESALAAQGEADSPPVNEWLGEYDWSIIAARIAYALTPGDSATTSGLTRAAPDSVLAVAGAGEGSPSGFVDVVGAGEGSPSGLIDWGAVEGSPSGLIDRGAEEGSPSGLIDQGAEEGSAAGLIDQGGLPPAPLPPAPLPPLPPESLPTERFPPVRAPEELVGPLPAGSRRGRGRLLDLLVSVLAVAAMAGLSSVRGIWILQSVELILVLSLPGLLLLRATGTPPEAVLRFPLYILCASIAVVMGSGLIVDLAGPPLGLSRPLATVPLVASLSAVCVLLIAVGVARKAPSLRAYMDGAPRILRAWPLLLPVIAWVGAMRLTNGHDAAVAIVAIAATGIALLVGAWRADRWSLAQSAILVYGASLALMWAFSLRGHFVYGFDISSEYQTFTQVLHAGRWYASHNNDAYGAMLSLTILPSTLVALTGASPLLILKAIYPLLFAFFSVGVFLLATRVLSRRFAYLAVLFIVVQDYLFQQLPAIARQEIGLLFFVCLVAAMQDTRLRRGPRFALLATSAVGMVVSHYGTTYLAGALLTIALVLELARGGLMRRPRRSALVPALAALAITAGAAGIWYAPVTDSSQNLTQFVSDVRSQGLALLPNSNGQGVVHSYLAGNVASKVSGNRYEALARSDYAKHRRYRYIHLLPQASRPAFRLHDASAPTRRILSHPILDALTVEQVIVGQLAIVLATIGALALWLRRRTSPAAHGLALLAVSTLVILAFIRLSGTVANDYNQERAYLQAMVPLSVCLAWLLERASGWRRVGRAVPGIFALALAFLFLTTSGLTGAALGGGTGTNLASKGEDFERYYVTQPELAAARWLNAAAPQGEIVSADRYGLLRITGATGRLPSVFPELTPLTLDRYAWIYAYTPNFLGHRARGQQGSRYAIYAWPSFVERFWNLVYANGSSGVYARSH